MTLLILLLTQPVTQQPTCLYVGTADVIVGVVPRETVLEFTAFVQYRPDCGLREVPVTIIRNRGPGRYLYINHPEDASEWRAVVPACDLVVTAPDGSQHWVSMVSNPSEWTLCGERVSLQVQMEVRKWR